MGGTPTVLVDEASSRAMPAGMNTSGVQRASTLVLCVNIIRGATAVAVGLIAIRFVLKLLATDPQTGLTRFTYGVTDPIVAPFTALLGNPIGTGAQFEVPALMAIAFCTLVGLLFAWEVALASRRAAPSRLEID